MMNITWAAIDPTKLFDPRRRAGRGAFLWAGLLYPFLMWAGYFFVSGILWAEWTPLDRAMEEVFPLAWMVAFVLAAARRFLDMQMSRWWLVGLFIPFISWYALLKLFFGRSEAVPLAVLADETPLERRKRERNEMRAFLAER